MKRSETTIKFELALLIGYYRYYTYCIIFEYISMFFDINSRCGFLLEGKFNDQM